MKAFMVNEMSEDGVKPIKKEPKIGIMMPGHKAQHQPSGTQLIIKPIKAHYGATTPDEREEQQSEEERIRKAFNSIPKFKKILLEIFNQTQWEFKDSGSIFSFKNNTQDVIKVEKIKDEIRFSGMPVSKLVEAANYYENKVDIELEFEVGANNVEEAKAFMVALRENGFDLRKINKLNIKTKAEYDIQEIVAEITDTPILKAKRPKPGGRRKSE